MKYLKVNVCLHVTPKTTLYTAKDTSKDTIHTISANKNLLGKDLARIRTGLRPRTPWRDKGQVGVLAHNITVVQLARWTLKILRYPSHPGLQSDASNLFAFQCFSLDFLA